MPDRATSRKVAYVRALTEELGGWSVGRGPLLGQLARAIARAIERGALDHGARLPAERVLADALAVSRGTVVAAYDLLQSQGLIERRHGSGTYVTGDPATLPAGREGSTLVHRLVDRGGDPEDLIDLSLSVLHDAADLPLVGLATGDLLVSSPATGLNPWGADRLRLLIADRVSGWGLPTDVSQVVITTGAQQAISVAAACWVRPDDVVVVDDPTYPGAIAAFQQAGARLIGIPLDAQGVKPGPLRVALGAHPALVYLQSVAQSPTGVTLSMARRRAIAEMVRETRVPLIEDLALADLSWERPLSPALPPIAALAGDASVAVIGSLSKLFWGGLRVGFVRAPTALALRFARIKATQDLGSSAVSQLLAERLLDSGATDFAERRQTEIRGRGAVLSEALAREVPDWRWEPPGGGLSLWVRIGADAQAFAVTARRHRVLVATAEALSAGGDHPDRLRLSFSAPEGVLREAARRLGDAWRAHTASGHHATMATRGASIPPSGTASPNASTLPSAHASQ